MSTFHIHIKGMVQGVGFRPHVYRMAQRWGVKGWVNNSTSGVHIMATANDTRLEAFYADVVHQAPAQSRITSHKATKVTPQNFSAFNIQLSDNDRRPDLLITPDFGLCADCRRELFQESNRRYRYPFTTCTQCGPRYSIIEGLPYDRHLTTMAVYDQCWQCKKEFHNPENRRYFSQTNSCSDCGIPMQLLDAAGKILCNGYEEVLTSLQQLLQTGNIVAVKGIGGYLLMCDATSEAAVKNLRLRKQRPAKPFAVLYPGIHSAAKDVEITIAEAEMLQSVTAPIVLCALKPQPLSGICMNQIAPGLHRLGVMLPYSPLLALIAADFDKPLVATSANVSGSPIIFNDEDAVQQLQGIADFFLSYDREIMVPQDDSVVQFSPRHQQQIILRRSRGWAPNYFLHPFTSRIQAVAFGAELKSSFALLADDLCYVSQYLGDQQNYEAQSGFHHTLQHLLQLLRFEPALVLLDAHPYYNIRSAAKEFASLHHLPLFEVQHHQAHFGAVLAENDLLDSTEPVLGVIWDGTGYGSDGNIWGGEFFVYHKGEMTRVAHLAPFPWLAGDKMSKEPRLSALALLWQTKNADWIRHQFTDEEWRYYQKLIPANQLFTSSMGRWLDAMASLLGICQRSSFEGEAAMKLEALAASYGETSAAAYPFSLSGSIIQWQAVLDAVLSDLQAGVEASFIAFKIHNSLALLVKQVADAFQVRQIAFSGGVMQNALLTDLFIDNLQRRKLFFHRQLSPNDECIAFGQLACMQLQEKAADFNINKIHFIN